MRKNINFETDVDIQREVCARREGKTYTHAFL